MFCAKQSLGHLGKTRGGRLQKTTRCMASYAQNHHKQNTKPPSYPPKATSPITPKITENTVVSRGSRYMIFGNFGHDQNYLYIGGNLKIIYY